MKKAFGALAMSGLAWLAAGEAAVARGPLKPADAMMAQFKSDTPIRVVPARPATPAAPDQTAASKEPPPPKVIGTARASSVGGLGFAYQASLMEDDQLVRIMAWVADSLNLSCGKVEVFGWPGVDPYKEEGKAVFLSIDRALKVEGYTYVMRELPTPTDPALAEVQKAITAYSGESTDRYARDQHIVTVWYKELNDFHLVLCRAVPKPPKKEED